MKKIVARKLLQWAGWRCVGPRPQQPRCVLIAAPHTSNWDFPLLILFACANDLKIHWLAKQSLFNPLIGWFMRALGGVPVNRGQAASVVDDMAALFARRREFLLVVPTEATRARTEFWKSGFYRIARAAQVPVVPTFLDFSRKQGGFGAPLYPGDDVASDMQYLRDFYADKVALYPDQFGPVRLREESL